MATHNVVRSPPPPPCSLGERQAEQPELAHRQHRVDGEAVIAVPRLGVRRDLGGGEVPHDQAEGLLLVAQVQIHRPSISHAQRLSQRSVSQVLAPTVWMVPFCAA